MKAENTTKIRFDSLSVNEAYARGAAAAFLARYDPTVPQLADLKTAVSEAVTNCIVHAYPDKVGPVTMTIAVYPDREVRITVADQGVGIPDIHKAMEPLYTTGNPEERSGLGLCGDAELYGQGDGAVPPGARYKSGAGQASVPAESGRYILKRNEAEKHGIGYSTAQCLY